SGPVAASAYIRLSDCTVPPKRVVLIGPTHRVMVEGLALPDVEAFATPLGEVALDMEAIRRIGELPQVTTNAVAHAIEHSLEVQLPFLQRALSEFRLIPLAAGNASPESVAEVLDQLWDGEETIIVISSDLSHYLPYEQATNVDMLTAQAIVGRKWPITHQQACGATGINGLLAATARHLMQAHLLDLRNSGDTAGDKARVVGYGAFALCEDTP
ncbi:MAG TPA: AmmeMemoRadiSam system protein B, partial [Mariprofundaceae bacterium]|nr:AmmeMemoRadiSam system protein B [Mariprofundaceae bacterium]